MKILRTVLAASLLLPLVSKAQVQHEPDLRAQTAKLIDAMSQRDVDAVMSMVSKSGISVGVGADTMKPGKFAKELRSHSGIYCALMDSHCIENRGRDSALIDTLRLKTPLTIAPAEGKSNAAIVTTTYGSHESELHFIFEDGAWKLTHVEWN